MMHGIGEAEVAVGGRDLSQWTFDSNNVLAWGDEAGYTAWLQFTVLPGGPVFMGTLHPSGEASGAGESLRLGPDTGLWETKGWASCMAPEQPGVWMLLQAVAGFTSFGRE